MLLYCQRGQHFSRALQGYLFTVERATRLCNVNIEFFIGKFQGPYNGGNQFVSGLPARLEIRSFVFCSKTTDVVIVVMQRVQR